MILLQSDCFYIEQEVKDKYLDIEIYVEPMFLAFVFYLTLVKDIYENIF